MEKQWFEIKINDALKGQIEVANGCLLVNKAKKYGVEEIWLKIIGLEGTLSGDKGMPPSTKVRLQLGDEVSIRITRSEDE